VSPGVSFHNFQRISISWIIDHFFRLVGVGIDTSGTSIYQQKYLYLPTASKRLFYKKIQRKWLFLFDVERTMLSIRWRVNHLISNSPFYRKLTFHGLLHNAPCRHCYRFKPLLLLLRVREAFCPRHRPHSGPIEL